MSLYYRDYGALGRIRADNILFTKEVLFLLSYKCKMAESRGADPQRFITVSMFSRHVPRPGGFTLRIQSNKIFSVL